MASGGVDPMLCISLQYNGKTILKPYGDLLSDTNMTFIQLIDQLVEESKMDKACLKFSCALELTDRTTVKVLCSKDPDSNFMTVRYFSFQPICVLQHVGNVGSPYVGTHQGTRES